VIEGLVEYESNRKAISVLVFNASNEQSLISTNTPVAWSTPVSKEALSNGPTLQEAASQIRRDLIEETKESLAQEILLMKGIENATGTSLFSLEAEIAEDKLWTEEEHLSAPVEDVAQGELDPPVHASTNELLEAIEKIYSNLNTRQIRVNPRKQKRLNIKASRLIDRLLLHTTLNAEVETDLPNSLDFSKNYSHLTQEQIALIKAQLKSEASFFMKGKYPSTIRTKNPIVIDVGGAAPRMSGYRRLNTEEQAVVDEYVAKRIEADVRRPLVIPDPACSKEGWKPKSSSRSQKGK